MKTMISKFKVMAMMLAIFVSASVIAETGNKMNSKKSAKMSIVEIAVSDARFSTLVSALQRAELVDALQAEGPFTVFAPTDDAFEALFVALDVKGIDDIPKEQLTDVLMYHVVSGKVMASDVSTGEVPTLNKKAWLDINASKSGVTINDNSKVIIADIEGSNGVIHVIDHVLVPSSDTAQAETSSGCN